MNKGMLAKVMGGLFDPRLDKKERDHNLRFIQIRWSPGMLGKTGDWAWTEALRYINEYREPMSFNELKPMLEGDVEGDPKLLLYCQEYTRTNIINIKTKTHTGTFSASCQGSLSYLSIKSFQQKFP